MQFKCCKRPLTSPLVFKFCAGLALLLVGEIVPDGHAQSMATPPPSSTKPKQAFVRFWNMLPGKTSDVLELLAAEGKPVTTALPLNYYAGYSPLPPGPYTFIIRRPADAATPLARVPVNLPADSYVTILASVKGGRTVAETINDTIDPKEGGVGRLVVRQYVADAHVTASIGTTVTPVLNYGDAATLEKLPATQAVVNVQATLASGPPKSWSIPVDYSSIHHATLLIAADPYGRFRPRLSVDGFAAIEPPPTAAH